MRGLTGGAIDTEDTEEGTGGNARDREEEVIQG